MATKMTREEALNKVRQMNLPKETMEILEALVPELAESEEERIRKALIEVFKKKLERGFEWVEYGIPNRSVLDWLEKQKEQKLTEWSEEEIRIYYGTLSLSSAKAKVSKQMRCSIGSNPSILLGSPAMSR